MPNKIRTWESTLIKSKDVKWKHILKNTDDGKLDFDLHLPLTELFRFQAKHSFKMGLITMIQFQIEQQIKNKPASNEDLIELFNKVGLPELANELKEIDDAIKNTDTTKGDK